MKPHKLLWLFTGLAVMAVMGVAAYRSQSVPVTPQPVAWDRETCAECRMLISDHRYAAQIQTADGRVLNFDDPSCLITYELREHPKVHAVYFHDSASERWLSAQQAAFLQNAATPMGHGLASVAAGKPNAITYSQAVQKLKGQNAEGK